MNKNRIHTLPRYIVYLSLIISVSACGGKKKGNDVSAIKSEVKKKDVPAPQDITRPPALVKKQQQILESNPDETISFEKWKNKQ